MYRCVNCVLAFSILDEICLGIFDISYNYVLLGCEYVGGKGWIWSRSSGGFLGRYHRQCLDFHWLLLRGSLLWRWVWV